MAMTTQEFIEKTGCEITGGNLIIGEQANRVKLGYIGKGTLDLSEFGAALMEAMQVPGTVYADALADTVVKFRQRAETKRQGKPMPEQV